MFLQHHKIKSLLDVVRLIHTNASWQDPQGFFTALDRVIPSDYSVAFMKMDPRSYKVVHFPFTISNGKADAAMVAQDHNDYFYPFKKTILSEMLKKKGRAFHLSTALATYLPKRRAEEYRCDFWEKHKVRYSYARYIKGSGGWVSIYLNRAPGRLDFSEEDRRLFDLLFPHLELVLEGVYLEQPTFLTDSKGNLLCADPETEVMLNDGAGIAARVREALPGWLRRLSLEPLRPLHIKMREGGSLYRFILSSSGTGRFPLYRVSWTSVQESPPLPKGALEAFAKHHRFSPREREILPLAMAGRQRKEMAQQLGLAIDTIKEYLGSIYRKAGVSSRLQLITCVLTKTLY